MNTNLPELVGTLADLPDHIKKTIEAYGKACAAVAVKQYKESLVVELPISQGIFDDYAMETHQWYSKEFVDSALQSAGINYREKG